MARDIALAIRAKIKAETGLNASAGISYNNFLVGKGQLLIHDRVPFRACRLSMLLDY